MEEDRKDILQRDEAKGNDHTRGILVLLLGDTHEETVD